VRQLIQAGCETVWQYPLGKSSRLSGEARLMFIPLVAPLAYLGCAVLDWSGLAAFFSQAGHGPGDRTLRAILHSQSSAAEI
jgi:hypothetical protein